VVQGLRAGMILWDKSSENMGLVSPVAADVIGPALTNLKDALASMGLQQIVPGGTDCFFKTRVSMISAASATVTTCDDGSKFNLVNPNTGVVDKALNATPSQAYEFVTWQMTRLNGHWAISGDSPVELPNALAKPCQPLSV
jgi:hypothetical protein